MPANNTKSGKSPNLQRLNYLIDRRPLDICGISSAD